VSSGMYVLCLLLLCRALLLIWVLFNCSWGATEVDAGGATKVADIGLSTVYQVHASAVGKY
jgi:hypothetical protein